MTTMVHKDGTAAAVLKDPVEKEAARAEQTARQAQQTANSAKEQADATAQYFWHESGTGTDAGAHVTEYTKSQWTNPSDTAHYHKGLNLLIQNAALKLRNGLTVLTEIVSAGLKVFEPTDSTNPVLQALSTGVVVGKETGYHIVIGGGKVSYYKDSNTLLFEISLDNSGIDPMAKMSRSGTYGQLNESGTLYLSQNGTYQEAYAEPSGGGAEYQEASYQGYVVSNRSRVRLLAAYHMGGVQKSATITMDADDTESAIDIHANTIDLSGNLRGRTETISLTSSDFTTTTGTFSSAGLRRFGNTLQLNLVVTVGSAVSAGSNLYEGTFKLADYRPQVNVYGVGYYGSAAIVGILRTDGTITLRVTGAAVNPTTPASNAGVSFTYLI